ncbi:hypothetical protein [Meiothermus hypogaeus]|uniref:Uncharacterized protein n=2 Tax=Meiothermus hypogaeus TaxID=884155 RepID=A0A511R2S6_9DEIN|nr:hypothetical protein [Meiothermus hypogaeus]RIH77733.1 hypothetical protein Mhypo_01885 [Meiothermus hypogaeus]GEM83627.1 hypothetical protein MHY01S_17930 [Meiothermus hypogaeus NBRC 106114]GIW36631.1 MAG: hypothetical protein KatS3mg073_0776 [Meiothermus sp.]
MPRKPPPDEVRLKALGVTRLRPGEATFTVRVRGKAAVLERFKLLTPEERGAVVEAGFTALEAEDEQEASR